MQEFMLEVNKKLNSCSADVPATRYDEKSVCHWKANQQSTRKGLKGVLITRKYPTPQERSKDKGNYTDIKTIIRTSDSSKLKRVLGRKRALNPQGHIVGKFNDNPLLDTTQYNVNYSDEKI